MPDATATPSFVAWTRSLPDGDWTPGPSRDTWDAAWRCCLAVTVSSQYVERIVLPAGRKPARGHGAAWYRAHRKALTGDAHG